ncbi:MAG: hypothetical protein ACE5IO_01645 [Thermoplasmata archaeon]
MYGMALPEPIPAIKKKYVEEFNSRWKRFKLSDAQKNLYEGATELYKSNPF